jgi:hypothetical protein
VQTDSRLSSDAAALVKQAVHYAMASFSLRQRVEVDEAVECGLKKWEGEGYEIWSSRRRVHHRGGTSRRLVEGQ